MAQKSPARESPSPAAAASPRRGLDRIDRRLLTRLQQDGRTPVSQLAREVHLTVTPALERVRRLESAGYIEGYFARLNPARLGLGLLAYVEVLLDRTTPDAFERFKQVMLAHEGIGRRAIERSEEHTSELQSPDHLVCRLLLEKKKKKEQAHTSDK